MFTIEQIKAAHSKVRSGADFPNYIKEIIALGVTAYEAFVKDGHTNYYGVNNYTISSDAKYNELLIANKSNITLFVQELKAHQRGETDYKTFCNMSADTGVEKWLVNMATMTCTYLDKAGNEMLVETIPTV